MVSARFRLVSFTFGMIHWTVYVQPNILHHATVSWHLRPSVPWCTPGRNPRDASESKPARHRAERLDVTVYCLSSNTHPIRAKAQPLSGSDPLSPSSTPSPPCTPPPSTQNGRQPTGEGVDPGGTNWNHFARALSPRVILTKSSLAMPAEFPIPPGAVRGVGRGGNR